MVPPPFEPNRGFELRTSRQRHKSLHKIPQSTVLTLTEATATSRRGRPHDTRGNCLAGTTPVRLTPTHFMSVFKPIPLGQRIPGSPHSVACSLPTLRDVIGYEEGQPETTRHITSGYPRFVVHSHAKDLCTYLGREPALAGRSLW